MPIYKCSQTPDKMLTLAKLVSITGWYTTKLLAIYFSKVNLV